MPNWIRNEIFIKGENASRVIAKCLNFDENGDIMFDFNSIIPMPKELEDTPESIYLYDAMKYLLNTDVELIGATVEQLEKLFFYNECSLMIKDKEEFYKIEEKFKKNKEENTELALKGLKNIVKYGFPNWYRWRLANWGTKWNSDETCYIKANENECELHFKTAWNCPTPIIIKMSQMFKGLNISGRYSDEDVGCNCGLYYTDKDKFNIVKLKDMSKEAYETYIDMWGMPSDLAFNEETQNYEWMEECENCD